MAAAAAVDGVDVPAADCGNEDCDGSAAVVVRDCPVVGVVVVVVAALEDATDADDYHHR